MYVCMYVCMYVFVYMLGSIFIYLVLIFSGSPPGCINFDFEKGNLDGWTKSGTAFNYQPTYGDNSKARRSQPANLQGKWFIGTYEKRRLEIKIYSLATTIK